MCLIKPVKYLCCMRVYVEVSKLPSCSPDFPEVKCPPDLCLQVHAFAPENKAPEFECWRCKAKSLDVPLPERERMRPKIDKAIIDLSSLETTIAQRRVAYEDDEQCWFCHSRAGCGTCGAKKISEINAQRRALWQDQHEEHEEHEEDPTTPSTKRLREPDLDSEAGDRKGKRRAKNSRKTKTERKGKKSTKAESSTKASGSVVTRGQQPQQPYYINPQHSSPHLMPPANPQYGNPFSPMSQSSNAFANRQVGSPAVHGMQSPYPELSGNPSGNTWYPPHPVTHHGLPSTPAGGWQSLNNISPDNPQSAVQMTPSSHGTANNDDLALANFDPTLFEATPAKGGLKAEESPGPSQIPMAPNMNANDFEFNGNGQDFVLFDGNDVGNKAPFIFGNASHRNLFANFDFQSTPSSDKDNQSVGSPFGSYPLPFSPEDPDSQIMSPFGQYPELPPDMGN
ncbi:hypothetical protein HYFRA_00000129 [Hymenoscyphus fraxineus]|uniref:Uncharacterized protein n=1 Tax=Hymenoscyphus fraxineus TaxID=746836 RepID=A0A9N9L110_9HELO|nr:hypothetical protein HYFRA_00000129 [Hymenoscyphus fraxineus]